MIRLVRRAVAALLMGCLVAGVAVADSSGTEVRGSGAITVERLGTQPGALTLPTALKEGDVLRLGAATDRATIAFADGATVQLVGPAQIQLVADRPEGRRVKLLSGSVTEAYVLGIAVEIQTPSDASFVLQNATGFARVSPGDRVTFQRRDGAYARVHQGETAYDLKNDPWSLNLRSTSAGGPAEPPAGDTRRVAMVGNDRGQFVLGFRTIAFEPVSRFGKTDLPEGGVRLCFRSKDPDEVGVVYVGDHTILFFYDGDCVEFDKYGNVTQFDGISHIYGPLTEPFVWDEPVENSADVSISRSSRR